MRLLPLSLDRAMARAARGDRRAMQDVYRSAYPLVARYVGRRIASQSDAEDVISSVFEKVIRKASAFDRERGTARAWILTIAHRSIVDFHRRRAVAGRIEVADHGLAPGSPGDWAPVYALDPDAGERRTELRTAVAGLGADDQRVLNLRFGDGLKHSDIAALLNISVPAAKKRLSRAVQRVRAELKALEAVAVQGELPPVASEAVTDALPRSHPSRQKGVVDASGA